jgi:hypothetical protein
MVLARDEQARLAEVIERLVVRYPGLPATTVAQVVHEVYAQFRGARLREYVPMLVERSARSALGKLKLTSDPAKD